MSTMIAMLHSPTKTFEYIREKGGSFTIPFIIVMGISLLAVILQLPMLERVIEAQEIDLSGMDVSRDTVNKIGLYMGISMQLIILAGTTFVFGLILLLLNLIVRGEATYMQLVKVALFSTIPSVISSLITGIMSRVTDMEQASDMLYSLGALFSEKEGFLFGLANIINPFSLWSLAIVIIGASVMCRRPIKIVGMWIGGVWFAIQLIFALLA